jgi:hypothetical protein
MRAALALAVCFSAALMAGSASAQASSTAQMSADISAPASITVVDNLNFNLSPQSLSSGLTITSSAANGVNANVLLGGAAGTAVSVSVPASFEVVNNAGGQTITVRTVGTVPLVNTAAGVTPVNGIATGSLFSGPVQVVGALDNGMLSFSIGGAVTVANNLAPGEYHGVLTVIAQYN